MNPILKNTTQSFLHLMTVNNDTTGNQLIKDIRANMKKSDTTLRVVLIGRGHRFGKGRGIYQSQVPLSIAQRVAVYVTARKSCKE